MPQGTPHHTIGRHPILTREGLLASNRGLAGLLAAFGDIDEARGVVEE